MEGRSLDRGSRPGIRWNADRPRSMLGGITDGFQVRHGLPPRGRLEDAHAPDTTRSETHVLGRRLQPDRDYDRSLHPDLRAPRDGSALVLDDVEQLARALQRERDDSSTEPARVPGRPLPAKPD